MKELQAEYLLYKLCYGLHSAQNIIGSSGSIVQLLELTGSSQM